MRIITLIIALFALFGCASDPINLESARPEGAIIGFATLSDGSNPADMAASAVYTRLARYRYTATRSLRAGRIGVDYARHVQNEADKIRTGLDTAVKRRDLATIQRLSEALFVNEVNLEKGYAVK
jgi:hypothetical protein